MSSSQLPPAAPGLFRRLRYLALLRLGRCLSPTVWHRLEVLAAVQQGKGFGTATCELEVRHCGKLLGHPPKIVLDVGANRGDYSAAILKAFPGCVVHGIDPSPACISALRSRFAGCDRIALHQIALSDSAGEACLYGDYEGSPLASLVQRRLDHFGIDVKPTQVVRTVTLDDFVQSVGCSPIDWIKLDVEGHELAVLRGASGVLPRTRVLQFEFGGSNVCSRTYFRDFWVLLTTMGFVMYRLGPGNPIRIDRYHESLEHFRTTNYVCVRPTAGLLPR
jgi:FkbM family methyltransferase